MKGGMKNKNMAKNNVKNMPLGVKILAILGYIGAALLLVGGIVMLVGSASIGALLANIPGYSLIVGAVGAVLTAMVGVMMLIFAVLEYFIARGLWNGKNWARVTQLVLSSLGLLGSIAPFNIINIVINGVVIWYLGFNKEAVAYFK